MNSYLSFLFLLLSWQLVCFHNLLARKHLLVKKIGKSKLQNIFYITSEEFNSYTYRALYGKSLVPIILSGCLHLILSSELRKPRQEEEEFESHSRWGAPGEQGPLNQICKGHVDTRRLKRQQRTHKI